VFKSYKSKSPGPDGWHQRFLTESAEELTVPLCVLFRKFLDSGFIPKEWKVAHVTPVFKKGNRQQASNYRPISLTSALCKVFESILKDEITEFLATNRLLTASSMVLELDDLVQLKYFLHWTTGLMHYNKEYQLI